MKRTGFALIVFFLVGVGLLQADQTTSAVQQALKEQGFYYGNVTGQKTADTTAAIRRYQIRNGLQITGEIDAETLRSLGVGSKGARSAPPAPPAPEEETNEADDSTQSAEISPQQPPPADYGVPRGPGSVYGTARPQPRPFRGGVFAGTPYEIAPPDLQRHVIAGAQTLLARQGFYRSGIDGNFGLGTQAAVRGFQLRAGLVPDGRLNMQTLAALGLLPGQHAPSFIAPSRLRGRPVYRGEWVPDR